jgi:hypothetical protein
MSEVEDILYPKLFFWWKLSLPLSESLVITNFVVVYDIYEGIDLKNALESFNNLLLVKITYMYHFIYVACILIKLQVVL